MAEFQQPTNNLEELYQAFANPTPSAYRDALVNIRTSNGIIAELQLHLEQIIIAKLEGHKYYEQEQQIVRIAELQNRELTPAEISQREAIRAKQKELYEAAFLQAETEERSSKANSNSLHKSSEN